MSDLRREFPDMKGFSPRNLKYMRAFAEAWVDESFVQTVSAQISWSHNCALLDKLKSTNDTLGLGGKFAQPHVVKQALMQRTDGWCR